MSRRIRRFLVLIIFIQVSVTSSQKNSDRVALQALKDAWEGTPDSWDDGSDPCGGTWVGITCTNSRVTSIILSGTGLSGGLPGDIGEFTELAVLDLSYNKGLRGSITPALGKLLKLTNLILVGCNFNGQIPDTIGNLERLRYLSLNSNGFTGSIPASLGKLKNLYWLDLSANQLTGPLPISDGTEPGLDMLTHAKHLYVYVLHFIVCKPSYITYVHLHIFVSLYISSHFGDNQLSGEIPPGLFNSNLTLYHLLFENNDFTGNIPSTLGLVQSLEVIRLDRNSLSGDVPSNINNLTNVTEMYLSNNLLTGVLPNLTGMTLLNYLDLSNNSFSQTDIPSWFSTLQSLTTIKMHSTNLAGELPAALFSIPQLQYVDLSNNRINGSLDISLNPSRQLELVDLRTNRISDFRQRRQSYTMGLLLLDNPVCTESDAADQKYCQLPTKTTTAYSTQFNNCTPPSCGSDLVASPNCQCAYPFTGLFSFKAPSFSSLTNATIYDSLIKLLMSFFHNATLPVDSVSLSNPSRNLEDYLVIKLAVFPSGQQSFNKTGVIGVAFALSNQTFKPAKADFNTYTFNADIYKYFSDAGPGGAKSKTSNTGIIIGSVVGGCVLVVLLVLAGMYAVRQKGRAERAAQQSHPFALWDPTSESGAVPQLKGAKSFTFDELKKYTGNFSDNSQIGAGGYGNVYKGSLPNGQLIAIKRARQGSTQGGLEFKTELELLSRVHHKNVVGLIGFCFDQGEQMLVYEYIVNGTLKDSLSGRSGIRLDWMRRLKIALGAARGLQYLHDLADPPIIHRDIKTNNILLDQRLVAKVSDFGLSKPLYDANRTHVTTQVKGTMGYMDPEYYMTQQLTEKSDVYSFGVVMLELITARNPIEKGKYIVREVKQVMDKNKELYNLYDVLDPTIGLSNQLKGLEKFVDLSLRCVEERGTQRPSMGEIVKELESIMTFVGLNPGSEPSTSASYEATDKDFNHPYSNDSLFAYSGGFLSPKFHPK
ncbi:leucine-rich repeat receptor protein kinase HPCA1-like isoform X3 [Bidens hawaiensis]|uniref:leucine-rich repeat receptor protein kinase HPCA1-like isoform X3 n=1 Tax=Bidens hawaiensis TaxID=980011 RepID=UPI0040498F00